jgi:hypothetical protein
MNQKETTIKNLKKHFNTDNVNADQRANPMYTITNVTEFNQDHAILLNALGLNYKIKRSGSTMTINLRKK